MTDETSLLPCPFCGSRANAEFNHVACSNRECGLFARKGGRFSDTWFTPEFWNRRAQSSAPTADGFEEWEQKHWPHVAGYCMKDARAAFAAALESQSPNSAPSLSGDEARRFVAEMDQPFRPNEKLSAAIDAAKTLNSAPDPFRAAVAGYASELEAAAARMRRRRWRG